MIEKNAEILKALGDITRLRIVRVLIGREICSCEIVPLVGKAQPTVSQHLKTLLQAGVLESRRDGVNIWYKIKNPDVIEILGILGIKKLRLETGNRKTSCIHEDY